MKILWSLPIRGEHLGSGRGDLVRAKWMIEALRKIGHEVLVVEFGAPSAVSAYRQVIRRVLPRQLAMMVRDAGRWIASIGQGRHVARHAMDFGADAIVETQVGFSFSGSIAANQTGLPLILDDCSPSREEEALGVGLPWLARHALRRQANTAAAIVVASHSIGDGLAQEGIPREKIWLFPNGIALQAFAGVDRENERRKLGLADHCVIGFAGSFQKWHATGMLAAALDALRGDSLWHLLLVGEGPTWTQTLQTLRNLGLEARVTAIGAVPPDCMPELIACFDIGVLPGSNDYGHPMKLLEYAAAGVVSVAPDLSPVRDVVRDFKTGLLFTPDNPAALVAVLNRLICDAGLRKQLGDQARRSVTCRHDWCTRASELVASIEPLLAKRQHHTPVRHREGLGLIN